MQRLYFAYGSNLASRRLLARAPGARARGRAHLAGFRLVADKPGRDGSAKLNIVSAPAGSVWGALWELREEDLVALDRFEGGYERVAVRVESGTDALEATTYASSLRGEPGLLRDYKALVLEGAREQGLPVEWIAALESLPER
jgi:gamma-glutamylcyclotransferase (GGCT)/AIG2-like uncharacterized protein YtfP